MKRITPLLACTLCLAATLLSIQLIAADYPTWWTARNVVITDAPVTNDFGVDQSTAELDPIGQSSTRGSGMPSAR